MILTTKTGLHYPDQIDQYKGGKLYRVIGARTAESGQTYYTVKNEAGQFKDMTPEQLKEFFEPEKT
jgi:hypothetical protein